MSSDFPSSVSCVSEICLEDDSASHINEETPYLNSIPTLYSIVQKAGPEFSYRFRDFRPSYPIFLARTSVNELFLVNFVYMNEQVPMNASMVFQATRGTFAPYRWQVAFNPWLSKGYQLDWINLYFVTFEPAIYTLERLFTEFYNLNDFMRLPADESN